MTTKKQKQERRVSRGACALCNASGIPKRSIVKHLDECPKRVPVSESRGKTFHIVAYCPYNPLYWLHLEAPETASLRVVDAFLRDIWLECCGHMSAFTIDGARYVAPEVGITKEYGDQSMSVKLAEILSPGAQFSYEYDFGSTTELMLEVLAHGAPKAKQGSIRLLARNDPPAFPCHGCGNPATALCQECEEEAEDEESFKKAFYCERCIDNRSKHPHDDEGMRMPVVNSPRMGVCGYTG